MIFTFCKILIIHRRPLKVVSSWNKKVFGIDKTTAEASNAFNFAVINMLIPFNQFVIESTKIIFYIFVFYVVIAIL